LLQYHGARYNENGEFAEEILIEILIDVT